MILQIFVLFNNYIIRSKSKTDISIKKSRKNILNSKNNKEPLDRESRFDKYKSNNQEITEMLNNKYIPQKLFNSHLYYCIDCI